MRPSALTILTSTRGWTRPNGADVALQRDHHADVWKLTGLVSVMPYLRTCVNDDLGT